MKQSRIFWLLLAFLVIALVACGGDTAPAEEAPAEEPAAEEAPAEEPAAEEPAEEMASVDELTILWAQWPPADYLAELVKDYDVTILTSPTANGAGGKQETAAMLSLLSRAAAPATPGSAASRSPEPD